MFLKQCKPLRLRVISSRIGSLLLLFQRSPLVQMLFPEVRIIGGSALAEMTKWSVATVAGLGVFDSVAGATTLTQVSPVSGSYTVPATVGNNLSFVFQCVGTPGKPASWQVIGELPTGLVHANATNSSTDAIQGIPAQSGSFLVTIKAWEKANYSGKSYAKNFTISVTGPPPLETPPTITSQPGSVTMNSGGTATLTVAASGSPAPSFQWYQGASGVTTSPISGATSATYTTPALTANSSYWVRISNSAGHVDSATATASIAAIEYILSASGANGTITGGGTYQAGSSVTITATPNAGYVFTGWTGDASGTTNPLTFVMTANKVIGATFSALAADSDGDGLSDFEETTVTDTNPARADTDGDGILDGIEVNVSYTNPLLADSNADGFSDVYAFCVAGDPFNPTVGNEITFDLSKLITTGQTLKLSGKLPSGLKFNATTGLLSGTLSGKAGTYQASVQVLQGKTVVRTIAFPITVLEFPATLIGEFDFLMEDANSVPSGVCKITITGANQWSATLESSGASKKRSAKGSFILAKGSPIAPITAPFPAIKASSSVAEVPEVTVNILIDGSTPAITGTYDGGTLRGFRLAKVGEMPPTTVPYSLVLDAGDQDGITVPAGLGWMKGKVSNKGIGTFKGLLGDATSANITLGLSAFGQAVLWSQPYKKKTSYIGGIVTLGNLGQTTSGEPPLTDEVWWTKTADATTLSYPNGFPGIPVTVGTSRWSAPATATALGESLGWRDNRSAEVIIDGGGLSNEDPQATTAALPTEFTLDGKFNLITSAPGTTPLVVWKGKAVKTDGSFTGTLTLPTGFATDVPGGTAAASGVLVQEERWGNITGCGLVQVPIRGAKSQFITTAFVIGK